MRPLEPIRQGVRARFGTIGEGVARGLRLRHDHGSNYLADDFQQEVAFFGIESSPSFVREPEGNGVAERFIRTLKENLLWVRSFDTIEELRLALLEGPHIRAELVGIARPDAEPLAAHQRAHQRDGASPRPYEQVAHQELAAHLALCGRRSMGRAIRAQPGRLRQHPGIPPIGFHAPTPFRIHRRVVRIGHDDLVAESFERLRDPFALGRRLELRRNVVDRTGDLYQAAFYQTPEEFDAAFERYLKVRFAGSPG